MVTSTESFERFQYLNFQTKFSETRKPFKKLGYHFLVKNAKFENATFLSKLPCQKSILRQIEWGVQN